MIAIEFITGKERCVSNVDEVRVYSSTGKPDGPMDSVHVYINGKQMTFRWIEEKKQIRLIVCAGRFTDAEYCQAWAIARDRLLPKKK